jgi:uncharacterized protein YjlB
MSLVESLKKAFEQVTGRGRPGRGDLDGLVRVRKARSIRLADDGLVPNNPKWPLVVYRSPVRLVDSLDPAAIFEELFARNGWGGSWRKGRKIELKAGDVAILPAGTGHQRLFGSRDLLVVGAYPPSGQYDEFGASKAEHDRAVAAIAEVKPPAADPVYGRNGPLNRLWRASR